MSLAALGRRGWRKLRRMTGYDETNWLRVVQNRSIEAFIRGRPPANMLEISPGWNRHWRGLPTRSYRTMDYPEHSIDRDVLPDRFDIVLADQVLEHVPKPLAAVRNMREMLVDGGHAVISTPFLFRVHGRPHDYHRWTPEGLRQLIEEAGFDAADVQVFSWGNRACVRAHVGGPVRDYGWHRDLRDDPEYPMVVWAFAKRRG